MERKEILQVDVLLWSKMARPVCSGTGKAGHQKVLIRQTCQHSLPVVCSKGLQENKEELETNLSFVEVVSTVHPRVRNYPQFRLPYRQPTTAALHTEF